MKLFALYNLYCKIYIKYFYPELFKEITKYRKKSSSTGTKYTTLYMIIKEIRKLKPKNILECGTGLSTIVICHIIRKINYNESYKPIFISMENHKDWYNHAIKILPEKYKDLVKITLSPRKEFKYNFFRGYGYSSIPNYAYDFCFIDGPDYVDDKGSSFDFDIVNIFLKSKIKNIRGVVDTRVTTCFAIQTLFGSDSLKYYSYKRASKFNISNILVKKVESKNFINSYNGFLKIKS